MKKRNSTKIREIQNRVLRALDQADAGKFAQGTGEEAILRSFRIAKDGISAKSTHKN